MPVCSQLHAPDTYPQKKSSWYPLNKGLSGPQSQPGCFGVQKNLLPLPAIKPRLRGHPDCIPVTKTAMLAHPVNIHKDCALTLALSSPNLLHGVSPLYRHWPYHHELYCTVCLLCTDTGHIIMNFTAWSASFVQTLAISSWTLLHGVPPYVTNLIKNGRYFVQSVTFCACYKVQL
jgi:hypothetical protein